MNKSGYIDLSKSNFSKMVSKVKTEEDYEVVKDAPLFKMCFHQDICVIDYDGPRENNEPVCLEVTVELLKNKINDHILAFRNPNRKKNEVATPEN